MKRIFVDENLPPSLVVVLQSSGIEAIHVNHAELSGQSDREIWDHCMRDEAAVATKDSDFVELVTLRNEGQVLLFAVGNMRMREVNRFASEQVETIRKFLESDDRVLVLKP